MKLLCITFIVHGMAAITNCCDCELRNYKWKNCGSEDKNVLKRIINASITKHCGGLYLNGTTENKLGKIHSMQVEADGFHNGILSMTFSDPNACLFKQPSPGEPETSVLRDLLPILCTKLEDKYFELFIPFSEEEKLAVTSIKGELSIQCRDNNINNVIGLTDCYDMSGTIHCEEEEDDY